MKPPNLFWYSEGPLLSLRPSLPFERDHSTQNKYALPGRAPPEKASEVSEIPTILPEAGREAMVPGSIFTQPAESFRLSSSIVQLRDNSKGRQ